VGVAQECVSRPARNEDAAFVLLLLFGIRRVTSLCMAEPLAYFLTWTCYGTWLHGDPRGSVDRHRNRYDTPVYDRNSAWSDWSRNKLARPPVTLSSEARTIVEETIEAHCEYRGWSLIVKAVRTNHVHVIATVSDRPPDRAREELMGWCTRRLRERGIFAQKQPVWTEGGSGRQLWTQDALQNAIRYVQDGQGPDLRSVESRGTT
jgi:REP element-mobilizing transposase RayT